VPPEFDRKLIAKTAKLLNLDRPFSTDEMRRIRGIFQRVVRTRPDPLASSTQSATTSTTASATTSPTTPAVSTAMSAAMSAAMPATVVVPPSPEAATEAAEGVVHPTPPQAGDSDPPVASN
jgi:hypothetical protein